MLNGNICKFNTNRSSDLICENFILETSMAQAEVHIAGQHVMNLVTKGEGSLRVNGCDFEVSRGSVFFIFRNETFTISSDAELEYSYISFSGRRADEYIDRLGINEYKRVFDGYERLIPFWIDSLDMCTDGNIDLLSESVLLYSVAVLTPEKKEQDDIIHTVTVLTHENFTDPDLTISTVADTMGYSSKYLSTVFKRKMGITYSEYLREMRIKHAIFLIENGVFSVKNVALLSGYRDALYFSKLFARQMGVSPKEYIKQTGKADTEE